ncbi:MAG: recombination protein RecR [Candidatus Pacebacteria bacterium]|nr:recombination protein RecR [Candidatus Paceibacterota bacterium]MBP9701106.1 recombination protein RecR [Candidatus Paceibacterota bacterium]
MQQELERLAQLFLKFPGIGTRQAHRFAYFILTQPEHYVATLAKALLEARGQAHTCTRCMRIYEGSVGMCSVCSDDRRDQSTLVVVEKSQDIDSFDRTDYRGLFFVLGGLIPIIQKATIASTNTALLVERVKKDTGLNEVILAFPLTPNGEHTDQVLREMIAPVVPTLRLSSLGRGLSAGAELEYADAMSLNASLKKRE